MDSEDPFQSGERKSKVVIKPDCPAWRVKSSRRDASVVWRLNCAHKRFTDDAVDAGVNSDRRHPRRTVSRTRGRLPSERKEQPLWLRPASPTTFSRADILPGIATTRQLPRLS